MPGLRRYPVDLCRCGGACQPSGKCTDGSWICARGPGSFVPAELSGACLCHFCSAQSGRRFYCDPSFHQTGKTGLHPEKQCGNRSVRRRIPEPTLSIPAGLHPRAHHCHPYQSTAWRVFHTANHSSMALLLFRPPSPASKY